MKWNLDNHNFIFCTEHQDAEEDIAILDNLVDNGIGECGDGNYHIPSEFLYELSEGQRKILEIPPLYGNYLNIETEGIINRDGFHYLPSFSVSKDGASYELVEANYPLVTLKRRNGLPNTFLLSKRQFEILQHIEENNKQRQEESSVRYNRLGAIKCLAEGDDHVVLNDYLEHYNVVQIDKVKLHLDYDDETLQISPDLSDDLKSSNHLEDGSFAEAFDRRNRVLPVYTLGGKDGQQHKMVIPSESEQKLSSLKQNLRQVKDKSKIQEIIKNPELYFDEGLFDLHDFYSDRVIEIGLYKPVFYSFVCPYKSNWIPGFVIEDPYNGNTNVFLDKEAELEEFKELIQNAEQHGETEFDYKGYRLDLDKAKEIYENAVSQNANPNKAETEKDGKKVLVIESNAESLGYREDTNSEEHHTTEFVYYPPEDIRENIHLKQHQKVGIAWLQHLTEHNMKGCLLADDMGLGKTLQVLAYISWHNRYKNVNHKPYIIVTPVSLLDNWMKEIDKFLVDDTLKPVVMHGQNVSRFPDPEEVDWLSKQNVILTNYETVRSGQFNICAVDYAVAVLDEAQKIKTPGTYVTCAAKALKADFKIAMTGTPVENTYLDLWCIMDFAVPGLLGNSKDFSNVYQKPLAQESVDIDALGKELREHIGVFFLRRSKSEVLKDLPEKYEEKREIIMTPMQQQAYMHAIEEYTSSAGNIDSMLQLLHKLRLISDSTLLCQGDTDIESMDIKDLLASSAKIQKTVSILKDIEQRGEKVIIFCIYKESQRMLQRVINKMFGIMPKIINGDTKVLSTGRTSNPEMNYSRQQAIDSFESKDGFNVIIMSPIAAGMGLNVTGANHVIHFGRHWNPAKEAQATDRAYRIGQDKPVYIYYPITKLDDSFGFNSFDQTLDVLLSRKSVLAEATLYPSGFTSVRAEDFQGMFNDFMDLK